VSELAQSWGLPATVEEVDVPALMECERLSPEEAARKARYRFLSGLAAQLKAAAIVLGHTSDDQVETVLMHLLRGSGWRGLRGMQLASDLAPWMSAGYHLSRPLRLVRPLLQVSRAETEGYCAAAGLVVARDRWNEDPRFLRVRLRQEIIPQLETINPRVADALLHLAQLAAWLEEDLQGMLDAHWPELAVEEEKVLSFDLQKWASLRWTLRLQAVRRALKCVRGSLEGVGWGAVVTVGNLDEATVGSEVALVEDVVFRREYDALVVGRRGDLDAAADAASDWPDLGPARIALDLPGRTELPGGHSLVATVHSPEEASWAQSGRWEAWLDAECCGDELWLRHRRPGDRFQPLGMEGQKKLQDFFVDTKVPRWERERVPLVVSSQGIVWVVGYRLDERVRVRSDSRQVIHLCWNRAQGGVHA
jgi:tRNA(Ile)-lysidine synthase